MLLTAPEWLICSNHPHNFYIQFLNETGAIGFLAALVMIYGILARKMSIRLAARGDIFAATRFVMPLDVFFQIATSADFFGRWNNVFMWSAIALALADGNVR